MEEVAKDQLRISYEELKFMLRGTPQPGPAPCNAVRSNVVMHYHEILRHVIELTKSAEASFDRFRLFPHHEEVSAVPIGDFRIQLTGVIGFINAHYFPDDRPISTTPETIINMSQTAIQQVHQDLIVSLTQQTVLKSQQFEQGTQERQFLDQFSESLKTLKSVTDVVDSILKIGDKLGMAIPAILKILPWT